jgi:hypothetical protein
VPQRGRIPSTRWRLSIQLNAQSVSGSTTNAPQYVFIVSGQQIQGVVQGWTCTNSGCEENFSIGTNNTVKLTSNTIPQNWMFGIDLGNASDGAVESAKFSVTDANGNSLLSETITLSQVQMFPISTFEVVVVGPDNCQLATFVTPAGETYSAAGVISYQADNTLCVNGGYQIACAADGSETVENSNVTYEGIMPPCCSNIINQSFDS